MTSTLRSRARSIAAAVGLAAMAVGSPPLHASTLDAQLPPWVNVNNFDLWIKDGGYSQLVQGVNEFGWTGYALSDFGAGAPTITNSVFTDYIVLGGQSLKDSSGSSIFGSGINDRYQLSLILKATGKITDGTTGAFEITGIDYFNLYVDAPGNGFTAWNFATGIGTFTDGNQALQYGGSLVSTTATVVPNTGDLLSNIGANGKFNLQFLVDSVGAYDSTCFMLVAGTSTCLPDAWPTAALTAAEVTFQGQQIGGGAYTGSFKTEYSNFLSYFGLTPGNAYFAFVSTSPDTNIAVVPEPATVGLLGAAFLGLYGARRRLKR